MAHDLRNSLATVSAAFEAIKHGRVGVTSKTSDVLGRHLRYLTDIVNELLGESKLSAGVAVVREAVMVGSFIEELVAAIPKRDDVRVETAIPPDLTVGADPQLLTSSVTNLLTHRRSRVVVRGARDGQQVLIEVEDQCGGLPDGKSEDLFAPFVQRSANRSGLGLGLWLVHEAMKAHGGAIRARNISGYGCVFTLALPVA